MYLVLIGAPGSGKGTQSTLLHQKLGLPHLSSGDMLRDAIRRRTPLGIQIEQLIGEGNLVSDEIIRDLIAERLGRGDQQGCLFDGFPRTLPQAEMLDQLLDTRDREVNRACEISVMDEELTQRIATRATTERRTDDTPATLQKRLAIYRSQTLPVLSHYRQRGVLHTIDGHGSPEAVFQRILDIL